MNLNNILKKELSFKKTKQVYYQRHITLDINDSTATDFTRHVKFTIYDIDKKVVNDISRKIKNALKKYKPTVSWLGKEISATIEK